LDFDLDYIQLANKLTRKPISLDGVVSWDYYSQLNGNSLNMPWFQNTSHVFFFMFAACPMLEEQVIDGHPRRAHRKLQ
jgi:hypothetical protein